MAYLCTKFHYELLQTNTNEWNWRLCLPANGNKKNHNKSTSCYLHTPANNWRGPLWRRYRWYFLVSRGINALQCSFSQGDPTEAELCIAHLAGQKKTLRKKGRCNLYVYKCQNVKACNPFKRWWGLWLELGTTPDFNTRKVLTPSSGGERWVLIPLSCALTLPLSLSHFEGIILVSVHMDL